MTIRLNKVTRDLNVGITTVVEFLQKKGYTIEANPNTKITDEQYDLLVKEFSTDKDLKLKTERFIQERQSKERNKASVAIDGYDKEAQEKPKTEEVVKAVVPEDVRPKFKPVGKIDLDKLNRKHTVEKDNGDCTSGRHGTVNGQIGKIQQFVSNVDSKCKESPDESLCACARQGTEQCQRAQGS